MYKLWIILMFFIISCGSGGGSSDVSTNTTPPITCPQGEELIGNACQPIIVTCPTGQVLTNGVCQPITCLPNQHLVGNVCITNNENLVGNYVFMYQVINDYTVKRVSLDIKDRKKSPENTDLYLGYMQEQGTHNIICDGYWSPSQSKNIITCHMFGSIAHYIFTFTVGINNELKGKCGYQGSSGSHSLTAQSFKYKLGNWDPVMD